MQEQDVRTEEAEVSKLITEDPSRLQGRSPEPAPLETHLMHHKEKEEKAPH